MWRKTAVHERLIPARAGNTVLAGMGWVWAAAHPRSRGEHNDPNDTWGRGFGSSPLARGTHWLAGFVYVRQRLIPARAGNTFEGEKIRHYTTAHPRSRGEHFAGGDVELGALGSSPLARGTHLQQQGFHRSDRLIPARAGNTRLRSLRRRRLTAHPRSRGEHEDFPVGVLVHDGSSPLARGTLPHA